MQTMNTDAGMMHGGGSAENGVLLSEETISKIREFASNPNHSNGREDAEKLQTLLENWLRKIVSYCCCNGDKSNHFDDTDKIEVGMVSPVESYLSVCVKLKDGKGAIGRFKSGSSKFGIETHFQELLSRCSTSEDGLVSIDL